jgi:hypothetical protein
MGGAALGVSFFLVVVIEANICTDAKKGGMDLQVRENKRIAYYLLRRNFA